MDFDEASRAYWAVRVVMIPNDPAIGVDPGLSSAAPFNITSHPSQIDLAPSFQFDPHGGGLPIDLPVALGGEPELPGAAAWVAGEIDAHNGSFSQASRHCNTTSSRGRRTREIT
jgi:hypothetical protein